MTNAEHYFENLLYKGKDIDGDVNKAALSQQECDAIECCAQYVSYVMFANPEELQKFIKGR